MLVVMLYGKMFDDKGISKPICITQLQKKAARLIWDADHLSPSKEMLKTVNRLPFKELVKNKQACLIYKNITDHRLPVFKICLQM